MSAKKMIENHGGLVGINYLEISDSYAVSSVGGGAICGINRGRILRCYGKNTKKCVLSAKIGKEVDSWAVRRASELQKSYFETWDFNHIWSINRKGFPIFKNDGWYTEGRLKDNCLTIDTADKLLDFANQIWAGNKEMAEKNVLISADLNLKNKKMRPIGTYDNPYTGIFDGGGHVISNVQIVTEENIETGLFGVITKAKICNLTVKGNIHGGSDTGLLCGVNDLSEIVCCSAIGEVHGHGYVGGLCGNNRGTVSRCNFYGYVKRKKRYGNFKWLIPVGAIFLLEIGTITVLAMTSPETEWKNIYKPIAKEKSIVPILNDRIEEKNTKTNSVTIKVSSQATYSGGEKLFLTMGNPSASNQSAAMVILLAEEFIKGKITYEEAKIYNAQYSYCEVAKTGAIPPGYQVESFDWHGYSDGVLPSGEYPAFVKIYFYDEETNEKSLIDSVFGITLKIE